VPIDQTSPRRCRSCGTVYPIDAFRVVRRSTSKGWTTDHVCRHCKRRQGREYKRAVYPGIAEYRSRYHRRYTAEIMSDDLKRSRLDYSSRDAWIRWQYRNLGLVYGEDVVVLLLAQEMHRDACQNRPWIGRRLTTRLAKPPISIPTGACTVALIRNGVPEIARTCPDDWRWIAHALGLRLESTNGKARVCSR